MKNKLIEMRKRAVDADFEANNKKDWERSRSFGATLTDEQIDGVPRKLWKEYYDEWAFQIKKSKKIALQLLENASEYEIKELKKRDVNCSSKQ
jgi:hypothetical protein